MSGEMGNVPAAQLASDIIDRWKPRILLVVGIAGAVTGRDQISLGDVIVHNGLIYYELQKILDGKHYERSMEVAPSSWILLQAANRIAAVKWHQQIGVTKPNGAQTPPRMHRGLILSGDKLLADPDSEELKRLLRQHDEALAVEMESGGIARAVWEKHSTHPVEFLIIRGVSDYCNARENQATRDRWRTYAARAAAAFALELIRQIRSPLDNETQIASLIARLGTVKLAQFCIVGMYARYEENTRNSLKDLKQRILMGLVAPSPTHENYLIWGPPGSGKTFFVQQVAANAEQKVAYHEINLTQVDEKQFRSELAEAARSKGATICLIDEIDSKLSETWPYETLLTYLEPQTQGSERRMFVLAGSSGFTLEEMKKTIKSRPKGNDLLSRIPHQNECSIPPMTPLDRVLVTIANIKQNDRDLGHRVNEVEKLALYYITQDEKLANARQLREFVLRGLQRIPPGEDRLKYDNLFSPGDLDNKEFWLKAHATMPGLANTFVLIDEAGFSDVGVIPRSAKGSTSSRRTYLGAELVRRTKHETTFAPPNNLPVLPTPIVGRNKELAAASHLLTHEEVRLLTLTGPAGSGKTALALAVARNVIERFNDGVYFVPLFPISDPSLVLPAIATTIGVKEVAGRSLARSLQTFIREKQLLLTLDNFEQVIVASPQIADILASCPNLKVVVTSREALRIRGEREFPVSPLSLPDLNNLPALEAITKIAAVALFVQRARSVKPDFELTEENARAVAEICVRVDGLPLALELAAARVKLLTPQSMAKRLENRLGLLTSGARDLPVRQQTLRKAIAWSHDLLEERQKKLFRRLAVFVGGFSMEAADTVCNADHDLDVMESLSGLLDKSLVKGTESINSETRFGFLETIHEFALERLRMSGEEEAVRKSHADFFFAEAQKAEAEFTESKELEWLIRLERDYDNLRAALRFLIERKEKEQTLCLAAALGRFWIVKENYHTEGRRLLDTVLQVVPPELTRSRAKVLWRDGALAVYQGDHALGSKLLDESLTISRQIMDKDGIAWASYYMAYTAYQQGNFVKGRDLYAESLGLFQELQDRLGIASSLARLGRVLQALGEYEKAVSLLQESVQIYRKFGQKSGLAESLRLLGQYGMRPDNCAVSRSLLEESLEIAHELGDRSLIGEALEALGDVERLEGHYERAAALHKESLQLFVELDVRSDIAWTFNDLGHVMTYQGNYREAARYLENAITLFHESGERWGVPACLAGFAGIAMAKGHPEIAARLFGSAESALEAIGSIYVLPPVERIEYECNQSIVEARMTKGEFRAAKAEGRRMTLEQAISYALATKERELML
jgi:predicted ATPase/nucleoside phosphorylase